MNSKTGERSIQQMSENTGQKPGLGMEYVIINLVEDGGEKMETIWLSVDEVTLISLMTATGIDLFIIQEFHFTNAIGFLGSMIQRLFFFLGG